MADENVTASENINETTEQATTPAVKASKPAVPSPASMKPHAPSPAAFAKKAPQHTAPAAASTGFSDADVKAAEAFGRVADDGTVFVKDGVRSASSLTPPRKRRWPCMPAVTLI